MQKVIVTGATGFVGRFLVRALVKQNVETIAVVRTGSINLGAISDLAVRIVPCDISDLNKLPDLVSDRDIDTLFHIAWQGVSDGDARDQVVQIGNLQSTLDVIDAMHEMGIGTFVGCGSMHEVESIIEMAQNKIVSNLGYMYKASKTAAHWMGKAKCGNYGIRFFWPLINTYGEEERSERLVNMVIRKIFAGDSPSLSDGTQYYDFVHVADVAQALCLIAEKGIDGKNYVIGSGEAKQLKEFLGIVGRVANRMNGGTAIPLGFGKLPDRGVHLPLETFDVSELCKDTGFEISVPFERGIERTARWIMEDMSRLS